MEYIVVTVLMVLVGWVLWRVRGAAYSKGEEQGCVRGIAIGERNIIAEVRRDELMVKRFERIPQVPHGYSLVETNELRQLQAMRERYLALPAPGQTSNNGMQASVRRAPLAIGGHA